MFGTSSGKVSSVPLTHSPPVRFSPLHFTAAALSPSLFIFVAYLVGVAALTAWILKRSVFAHRVERHGAKWEHRTWTGLAATSFLATWYHMIRFFFWSYSSFLADRQLSALTLPAYPHCNIPSAACSLTSATVALQRVSLWLRSTTLFWQAWERVISNEANWWYSAEICAITVGAWALFVRKEGTRVAVPHLWAYMVLGQLVAISVAMNLFFLSLSLRPNTDGTLLHQTMLAAANEDADGEVASPDTVPDSPSRAVIKTIEDGVNKKTVTTTRSTPFPFETVGARIFVWFCVLQGLVAVWTVPNRSKSLINVLSMHLYPLLALLVGVVEASPLIRGRIYTFAVQHLSFIPSEWLAYVRSDGPATRRTLRYSTLHILLATATFLLKARTTINLWGVVSRAAPPFTKPTVGTFLRTLYPVTFHSHPAQASISADALLVGLSLTIWMALDAHRFRSAHIEHVKLHLTASVVCAILVPILGPACAFALFCATREHALETIQQEDEERILQKAGLVGAHAHADRSWLLMNTTHTRVESSSVRRGKKRE